MPFALFVISEERLRDKRWWVPKFVHNFMSKLLRKVQYKTNWSKDGEFVKYLPPGEAPADALLDMKTRDNMLSVWEIADDKANFDRVVAAIASSLEHLQKVDVLLFDPILVQHIGIKMEQGPGETHDPQANAWHFNLIHLSATNLGRLASSIFAQAETVTKRFYDGDLIRVLKDSINNGHIDPAKLQPRVREKVLAGS